MPPVQPAGGALLRLCVRVVCRTELLDADGDDVTQTGRSSSQTAEHLDALNDVSAAVVRHEHASAELNHDWRREGGS